MWSALCEIFDGCSLAAIRAEQIRMTRTRMRPGQDADDHVYHMDSCRDRLQPFDSPEAPMYRQYEDIILQVFSSEYDRIRHIPISRGETSALPTSTVLWRLSTRTTFPVQNHQKASRDEAPQCRRWTGTALMSDVITATNLGI